MKTFAIVARLKSIRILIVFIFTKDFKFFPMNVKSIFLNSLIEEEVLCRIT